MSFLRKLEEIAEHFYDVDSAIKEYFAQVLTGDFHNRPGLADNQQVDAIRHRLQSRLLENDRAISLVLLAALESCFRLDCEARDKKLEKSPLDERLAGKKRLDDILGVWSEFDAPAIPTKQIIGEVRGVLKYRHWLAHGRYWPPNLGREYSFDLVYGIAEGAAAMLEEAAALI